MALPIRTTVADIEAVCSYLATKPTGASTAEAKAVLDSKVLDGRKLNALKFWGLIDDNGGKMRLTEPGRRLAKDKGAETRRRAEGRGLYDFTLWRRGRARGPQGRIYNHCD